MPTALVRLCPEPTPFSRALIGDFLMAAALHQVERVRNFIEVGGIPADAATFDGKPTAICYVVLKPHRELMHYLVSRGARVNQIDAVGMTPLHYAVLGGCEYCISYLVSRGADLNRANFCGNTPLALTLDKPHLRDCREMLERRGASLIPGSPILNRLH